MRMVDGVIWVFFFLLVVCWWVWMMELLINCIDCGDFVVSVLKMESYILVLVYLL